MIRYFIQDTVTGKAYARGNYWLDITEANKAQIYSYATLKRAKSIHKDLCLSYSAPSTNLANLISGKSIQFTHTFTPFELVTAKIIANRIKIVEVTSLVSPLDTDLDKDTPILTNYSSINSRIKACNVSYSQPGSNFKTQHSKSNIFISNIGKNWKYRYNTGHQIDIYGKYGADYNIINLGVDKVTINENSYWVNGKRNAEEVNMAFACVAQEEKDIPKFKLTNRIGFDLTNYKTLGVENV